MNDDMMPYAGMNQADPWAPVAHEDLPGEAEPKPVKAKKPETRKPVKPAKPKPAPETPPAASPMGAMMMLPIQTPLIVPPEVMHLIAALTEAVHGLREELQQHRAALAEMAGDMADAHLQISGLLQSVVHPAPGTPNDNAT